MQTPCPSLFPQNFSEMQNPALLRFHSSSSLPSHPFSKLSSSTPHKMNCSRASSKVEVNDDKLLSARERRKMRNERREKAINSKPPWPEVVAEKRQSMVTPKPKVKYLGILDTLAYEGVKWWDLSVRQRSEKTVAKKLFLEFRRLYPHAELEIFVPELPILKKSKDGSYSKSMEMIFPGNIFIKCLLNREIVDFIKHFPTIYDIDATKVTYRTKSVMRPMPVPDYKMESMIKAFKEEHEKRSQEIEDKLAQEVKNKKGDSLVRQGYPKASIAKNAKGSLLKRLRKQRKSASRKKKSRFIVGTFRDLNG